MSVNIHTSGEVVPEPETAAKAKSGEHRPPPIPADALKADGKTNRARLEASANALRARLARTLESLDRRRHDALNVQVQAARHPIPLALAAAAGTAVVVGGTALTLYHARKPPQSELAELAQRLRAAVRALRGAKKPSHPDQPSIVKEVARGVVISVASYAISQIAQRALDKYFPPPKETPPK